MRDAGELQPVDSQLEISNGIDLTVRMIGKDKPVGARAANKPIVARPAVERIASESAAQSVATRAAE